MKNIKLLEYDFIEKLDIFTITPFLLYKKKDFVSSKISKFFSFIFYMYFFFVTYSYLVRYLYFFDLTCID